MGDWLQLTFYWGNKMAAVHFSDQCKKFPAYVGKLCLTYEKSYTGFKGFIMKGRGCTYTNFVRV